MRTLSHQLALLLAILTAACANTETIAAPTQIMLRISSDAELSEQLTRLRVSVSLREGDAWKAPVTQTFEKGLLHWPVDIPIVPRVHADAFKQFQVVVEALDARGVLAQTRVISSFAPGERRVLEVTLFLCPNHDSGFVCAAPSCDGWTCEVCVADGSCVPVQEIDPKDLPPLTRTQPEDDASVGMDTGTTPVDDDGATQPDAPDISVDANTAEDSRAASDGGTSAVMDGSPSVSVSDASTSDGSTNDASSIVAADAGADAAGEAGGPAFVPLRFSATDHEPHVYFSADGLSAEHRGEQPGNARSDRSIVPGSGVFYFEGQRLIDSPGQYGVGVASAAASLTDPIGSNLESLGVLTNGDFADTGSTCSGAITHFDPAQTHYGFVVDYRGATPRLHLVLEDDQSIPRIMRSCSSALTTALYIFYSGARYEVGLQLGVNAGSDTTNFPFYFPASAVKNALTAIGETSAAAAWVAGFGQTRALPADAAPLFGAISADRTVAAGSSVALTASASDAEDGDLTSRIIWTDLSSQHHAPVTGMGGSFSFTASLGNHPIRVSVSDSVGVTTSRTITVRTSGSVTQVNPVRLVIDDLSDQGAPSTTLASDGLGADFRGGSVSGMRANQAIFGQYWYFEAHRNISGPASTIAGVVTRDADLNPFDLNKVPWCAYVHMTGSNWYNGNSVGPAWDAQNNHYGFAVDYRGDHPIVHILIGGGPGAASGVYQQTIVMKDVWLPLYPMLLGAWADEDPALDATLNFGATPFVFDPVTVLGATRAAGLEVGWGNANTH